ncbi:pilin [Patescibacteria group bacterium]|nr:pilin [Patescibacteria group bacterium]
MLGKTKKLFLFSFIAFLFAISIYSLVLAQDLEIDYPDIIGKAPETVQDGLPAYVKYIFNFAIAISAFLALASLIYGGILYITSGTDPSKLKAAKDQLTGALLGIVILFSSYLILVSINPQLLILEFGPLTPVDPGSINTYTAPEREVLTWIVAELPLKSAMTTATVWEEERTEELETLITDFEGFLKEEIDVDDPNLENDKLNRISDLNKYLKTVTDECRCENTKALCTKPQSGSMPIGCSGDPCENDDDNPTARERIKKVLNIDREKIKTLSKYEKKVSEHKELLREELRKFQEIEGEIISCRTQNQEFMTRNDLLLAKQQFEELGNQVIEISGYKEAGDEALTFYCSVGGTIYDAPYTPQKIKELSEETPSSEKVASPYEIQLISCHTRIPTGETIDQLRELAIIAIFKLEELSRLTEKMAQQVQEMTELVSQCNRTYCEPSCSCIPNPWYRCCSPIPCGPMAVFCRSKCLQSIQGCSGDACPVEEITKKSEEIKETEDKILEIDTGVIAEIKKIFPAVLYHAEGPKNPYNLHNLDAATRVCFDPNINNPEFILLSCEGAKGNYGPSGTIMTSCNPRDVYCCSPSATPPLPISSDSDPLYIVPLKEHSVLSSEDGCPKGFDCTSSVRNHDQYENDASKPLKQLLSCMRQGLDKYQEAEEETEEIIGLISSISDEKLYTGKCEWGFSPKDPRDCSHIYGIEQNKMKVSAHYGGTFCRDTEESYAVDFDMSSELQRKYIDEIIDTAKKCSSEAYVLDKITHIHIDIGELYDCETSDF